MTDRFLAQVARSKNGISANFGGKFGQIIKNSAFKKNMLLQL
jgi:hypothetical protein